MRLPGAANQHTTVYVLLTCVVCLLFWQDDQQDHRTDQLVKTLQGVVRDVEAESARTDLAFCHGANANRRADNERAEAIRKAVRIAFAGRPELQEQILAEIPADQPQLDCSGIGDRKENFSKQPAINGVTTAPPVAIDVHQGSDPAG